MNKKMNRKRLLELAGMQAPNYAEPETDDMNDENGAGDEFNPVDHITVDVPLLIRLLEWAKEDSQNDMQLHKVAENLTKLSEEGEALSMENYEAAIAGTEDMAGETPDDTGDVGNDHGSMGM